MDKGPVIRYKHPFSEKYGIVIEPVSYKITYVSRSSCLNVGTPQACQLDRIWFIVTQNE